VAGVFWMQVKEAKGKCFRNVYAKDVDADLERLSMTHLNNDEETEIDKSDLVDGNLSSIFEQISTELLVLVALCNIL